MKKIVKELSKHLMKLGHVFPKAVSKLLLKSTKRLFIGRGLGEKVSETRHV